MIQEAPPPAALAALYKSSVNRTDVGVRSTNGSLCFPSRELPSKANKQNCGFCSWTGSIVSPNGAWVLSLRALGRSISQA